MNEFLWFPAITTEGEAQCGADFLHPRGTQLSHAPPQPLLRDRNRVVQIDCTGCFHAILFVQDYLRRDTTDGRGDRRYGDGR